MARLHNWTNPAGLAQEGGYAFPANSIPPWISGARCGGTNNDDFFPTKGVHDIAARAKKVCADCPVKLKCLEWALEQEDLHGIWGGTSPNDRRRLLGKPVKGGY